jgi:hypothetical protein
METIERYGSPSTRPVARAAARRQDPQRLRDDRAGRASSTRPTSRHASSGKATTTSSTAASGGPAVPATRAARSTSSWARPIARRRVTRSSR